MPSGNKNYKVTCISCQKDFFCTGYEVDHGRKYCSKQCCGNALKPKPIRTCQWCNKEFVHDTYNSQGLYCSIQCSGKGSDLKRKANWEKTINERSLMKQNAKKILLAGATGCARCGWNDYLQVLEVHHKDRNHKNNFLSNLELICPNCHSVEHYLAKDGQYQNNLGLAKAA